MSAATVILGIVIALLIAGLDAFREGTKADATGIKTQPSDGDMGKTLIIDFGEGRFSPAVHVRQDTPPQEVVQQFGLVTPRPAIFISGGAGQMSADDIKRTQEIMTKGLAAFAEEHHITVVDGGTESGVMKMIGDARKEGNCKFPLIGVSPAGLVSYPGYTSPQEQAVLEDGHSHFVLVEGDNWGDESQMIVDLTRAIANGQPMIGVLINGGKIAEQDVYLATAKAQHNQRIPILILEGSGRTADNISTAFRTGQTQSAIIRAIVTGGDIRLTSIDEGADAMYQKLKEHFEKQL
jgi:hypothetical protein